MIFQRILNYWALFRPKTLLPPAVGMVAGALAAWGAEPSWQSDLGTSGVALRIFAGALMAAFLNAASNTLNQIADIENDKINKPHRMIPAGGVTVTEAAVVATICWVIALTICLVIRVQLLLIVLAASACVYAYSMPPFRLRARPFPAAITIAIPRGLLLPVAGWATVKSVGQADPWAIGLVFFLFILGASGTKDFSDMKGDQAAGCCSLPVLYGTKTAARIIAPFFVLPFLLIPVLSHFAWLKGESAVYWLLTVVLLPWGLYTIRLILKNPDALAEDENHPSWAQMYRMMMVLQGGMALAYLI